MAVAGTNPITASSFMNDPAEFNPVYTTSATASNQQLQLLQDALQYLQQNPNTPNASQLTQELNQQIGEQQNISNYDTDVSNQGALGNTLQQINQIQSYLQGGQWGNTNDMTSGDWTALGNFMQQNGQGDQTVTFMTQNPTPGGAPIPQTMTINQAIQNMNANNGINFGNGATPLTVTQAQQQLVSALNNGMLSNAITNFTNSQLDPANTAVNNAQSGVLNNISFMSPDYGQEMQDVNSYYYGNPQGTLNTTVSNASAPQGEINQSLIPQEESLYQQNWNLRNGINAQMAAAGDISSGSRQKALADQNAQAVNAAATDVANATNNAATAINTLNQTNTQQQATNQNTINQLQQGGISNALSSGTNTALQNAAQQNYTNENSAVTTAESANQAQQNQTQTLNSVLGAAGSGAGSTVSSLTNPYLFMGPQV